MKTIAFAGSNSSTSINQQLIEYAVELINNVELIKLTDYKTVIYSEDTEKESGIPEAIKQLNTKLSEADKLIISVNEHNGNISAFFKNILDWLSRNKRSFLADKKVLLLSTSPGANGAKSALAIAEKTLPYFGATILNTFSLPSFYDNFKDGKIVNEEANQQLLKMIKKF
ncbi:NADPH-dependent FMN reductase [Tenacibaculum sp. UWU-22]|uniref:NADPH-dependent FMN reductase n=1 Tax=Tenacibaculum sp. UWU-22 TaxID=3234187 RepID=UPI0034DAC50B